MTEWHDGTTLDDQLVASWRRLKPERMRAGRLPTGMTTLETALSWLRRYPKAWLRVVAEDLDAAAIAVRHRWRVEPLELPTDEQIAYVERAARQAIEAIHGAHIAADIVPLRAAATIIRHETKRGPPVDA